MRTEAAVLWQSGSEWKIEQVELDEPRRGEVLVAIAAAGLCHSEEHHVSGDVPFAAPMIGGHEGAGVVEAVGDGVTSVEPGDHVVFSSIPNCGRCPSCATGRQNLCDQAAYIADGLQLLDHTSRHHAGGADLTVNCMIGSYARHTVASEASVVKIDPSLPLTAACLVGCGVATGWGSAVYAGGVRPGDDVAVIGVGGLGCAAVQGARMAGARRIFAVDPVGWKREAAAGFGATHAAPDLAAALPLIRDVTWGRMCNVVVLTMSVGRGDLMGEVMALVAKRGRAVVTNIHPARETTAAISLLDLTHWEKQIVGCVFGSVNSRADIPRLLGFYADGLLDLDGMITRSYRLDEINQGYQDLRDGRNIRGVLRLS